VWRARFEPSPDRHLKDQTMRSSLALALVPALVLGLALRAGAAAGQSAPPPLLAAPIHIPTHSGEVILPNAYDKQAYDDFGYAAVRRAGDLVFISGVVVGRRPDEGTDVAAFKDQVRRTFRRIDGDLKAAGLSFDDVVMINSFHVWQGPNFTGSRKDQFKAFEAVKEEFMHGPKPAWTAVGTTALLPDAGIVEVQMIAQTPRPAAGR
jgi:enamine deaminase RidA (YjgF/YER057c/UK114 family)